MLTLNGLLGHRRELGVEFLSARDPVWVRRGRASKRVRAHMRSIALALVQRAVEDKRVRCLAQILGWSAQPASGLSPWRSPSAFS